MQQAALAEEIFICSFLLELKGYIRNKDKVIRWYHVTNLSPPLV